MEMQEEQSKMRVDRRQNTRLQIVDYALINLPNFGEGLGIPALIVDIGLGGLQTRSRSPLPPDTRVHFTVGRGGRPSLSFHANVRYCNPVPDSDLFALGFKFEALNADERKAIVDFIHDAFHRQGETLLRDPD